MANAWKREKPPPTTPIKLLLLFSFTLFALLLIFFFSSSTSTTHTASGTAKVVASAPAKVYPLPPFDCIAAPQAAPVIANLVEGVPRPFLYSLADLGSLPDKPHKNIARTLKGKRFRRPDISSAVQDVLARISSTAGGGGVVVDVGANVGMAAFAAAAMGFRVLAFEPVFENLQRICDGVFLNRAADLVTVFAAAVSEQAGNITIHKLVGRLDNSAISETGARLAFKSNKEVALEVKTIPLDDMIPDSEKVILLKIDVQGWEYHVLKGAKKILSKKGKEAPYIIYEEDERLLQASNSSAKEIRDFLSSMGYNHCTQHGTDAHCTKE